MSWFDPDGKDEAYRGRRWGPKPLLVTADVLSVDPYDSFVGKPEAAEIIVAAESL
jgi:hypothetical protein